MKPWMQASGLTDKGAVYAEHFLTKFIELYEGAQQIGIMDETSAERFLEAVAKEAKFRVFELKNRDPKWAKQYLEDNE